MAKSRIILGAAEKTLSLFELMCCSQDENFSVTDLTRLADTSKTSVYRMLQTLRANGLVDYIPQFKKYRVSWKIVQMGAAVVAKTSLQKLIRPLMERTALAMKETVNLAVLQGTEVIYIDKIDSPAFLRADLRVGTKVPVYCSALGKVLIAGHSEDQLKDLLPEKLPSHTKNTITERGRLIAELEKVRKNGYSVDRQEFIEGITAVGAPIVDSRGKIAAAISVAGPSLRITEDRVPEIGTALREIALEGSLLIGYKKQNNK